MKRAGNLMTAITSESNLYEAHRRARRGKGSSVAVSLFEERLFENLCEIGHKLSTGTYVWGDFERFKIFDPKEREIAVPPYRDRVAHQALLGCCEPYFESAQIDQSFACRKGKGQTRAVALAAKCAGRARCYLKMDVRKYFASIDREILKELIARRFKDKFVLRAFYDVVDSFEPYSSRGLPLGCLTSQFFANHYLTPLDRYVKEELKLRSYVRYMDDFILWHDELDALKQFRREIESFLDGYLHLSWKEASINYTSTGLTFLGMSIYPNRVRLASRSRVRFRRRYTSVLDELDLGRLSEEQASERLRALFAHVSRSESKAFRLRVIEEDEVKRRRLEPRAARRQLEQQRPELPVG